MPHISSGAALVTGASSGIGYATARALAAAGYPTVATARHPDTLADLAAAGCHTLTLDVTDEGSMTRAVPAVEDAHGGIAALINNAGYGEMGLLEEVPIAAFRRQLETNVVGALRLCRLVLPGMRERGYGRIVNVSTMGGVMAMLGGGAYYASKHALEALSGALRAEVAPFGIEVVVIQPGLVWSGFNATARASGALAPNGGPYDALRHALVTRAFGDAAGVPRTPGRHAGAGRGGHCTGRGDAAPAGALQGDGYGAGAARGPAAAPRSGVGCPNVADARAPLAVTMGVPSARRSRRHNR